MNLDLSRLRAQRDPQRLARVTGVPIHEIKELLGHSSVATTERYAHGRVTDETRARIGAAL